MKTFLLTGVALLLTLGCSRPTDARHPDDAVATESGGRHEPQSKEERELLERVANLPADVREKLGQRTVSAAPAYHAASGYTCRDVTIEQGSERITRLACGDKDGWFFVPDIYHQGEVTEVPSEPTVRVSATGEATVVDAPRAKASGSTSQKADVPEEEGL